MLPRAGPAADVDVSVNPAADLAAKGLRLGDDETDKVAEEPHVTSLVGSTGDKSLTHFRTSTEFEAIEVNAFWALSV